MSVFTKVGPDMTWPSCSEEMAGLAWRLRYARDSITDADKMIAASVIDAYLQLVSDTQKKRNMVCKELMAAHKKTQAGE